MSRGNNGSPVGRGKRLGAAGPRPVSSHRSRGKPKQNGGQRRSSSRRRGGKPPLRPWRFLIKWSLVAAVWGGVILGGAVGWLTLNLPPLDLISSATRQPSIVILDRHGTEIAAVGDRHGRATPVSELPPHLIEAFLATEDRRFRDHFGLDPVGLARAVWVNLKAGRVVQGGSTITQQLAKTLFLTPERSLKRKIQEAVLSLWLESKYEKDQILGIYLNRIYFGAGAYGIEAAARIYFGKSARTVSLYESAVLAGLPKAPSRYAPSRDPALAHQRARVVLGAMQAAGYLGEAERRAAAAEGPPRRPGHAAPPRSARYFADWILPRARAILGGRAVDAVVRTTLDLTLQAQGEVSLSKRLREEGQARQAGQAALLSMTPDGAVRAMIGGRDYGDSQYNRVTQARRQPGSAFKLFVYLAALEAGFRPDQVMIDEPVTVDGWVPANYSGEYAGAVTLSQALADSINSVAVKLTEKVGRDKVIAVARRLGVTGPLPPGPALALGAGEVTLLDLCAAYAALANDGQGVWPYGIKDIRSRDGEVIYRRQGSGPGQVIAVRQAVDLRAMLKQVIETGTGRVARLDRPAAGKTGTSQNFRDAWFIGFSEGLVAGAWFGNDGGQPMKGVTGGGLPARLWRDFMQAAYPTPGAGPESPAGQSQSVTGEEGIPANKPDNRGFWHDLMSRLGIH